MHWKVKTVRYHYRTDPNLDINVEEIRPVVLIDVAVADGYESKYVRVVDSRDTGNKKSYSGPW